MYFMVMLSGAYEFGVLVTLSCPCLVTLTVVFPVLESILVSTGVVIQKFGWLLVSDCSILMTFLHFYLFLSHCFLFLLFR